jgi:hypothetical protein
MPIKWIHGDRRSAWYRCRPKAELITLPQKTLHKSNHKEYYTCRDRYLDMRYGSHPEATSDYPSDAMTDWYVRHKYRKNIIILAMEAIEKFEGEPSCTIYTMTKEGGHPDDHPGIIDNFKLNRIVPDRQQSWIDSNFKTIAGWPYHIKFSEQYNYVLCAHDNDQQ